MTGRSITIWGELGIQVYSGVCTFLAIVLRCISPWSKPVRDFLVDRKFDEAFFQRLADLRRDGRETALFFCSSAGEFEQAKPLIARWSSSKGRSVHVVLFSQSGVDYLKARGESLSYSKAPIDTIRNWRRLMRALQPALCFVIKYELWPAFLVAAWETTPLVLVDGVVSNRLRRGRIAKLVRSLFLRFFAKVFVVAASDKEFFCHVLGVDASRVEITGDTKYDRVRERAQLSDAQAAHLKEKIDGIFGPARRLIVGSGWHKDIDLALACSRSLIQAGLLDGWQLVIAPHLVDHTMISWVVEQCRLAGLSYCLYSELADMKESDGYRQVIILDKMGTLAEFYACGQAAFVGGGLHHQVHNVLEPAIRGLYLAFGPRYHNSAEARLLVDGGLAQVVEGEQQLYTWWRSLIEAQVSVHNVLLKRVQDLCGSADAIMDSLPKVGHSDQKISY